MLLSCWTLALLRCCVRASPHASAAPDMLPSLQGHLVNPSLLNTQNTQQTLPTAWVAN